MDAFSPTKQTNGEKVDKVKIRAKIRARIVPDKENQVHQNPCINKFGKGHIEDKDQILNKLDLATCLNSNLYPRARVSYAWGADSARVAYLAVFSVSVPILGPNQLLNMFYAHIRPS